MEGLGCNPTGTRGAGAGGPKAPGATGGRTQPGNTSAAQHVLLCVEKENELLGETVVNTHSSTMCPSRILWQGNGNARRRQRQCSNSACSNSFTRMRISADVVGAQHQKVNNSRAQLSVRPAKRHHLRTKIRLRWSGTPSNREQTRTCQPYRRSRGLCPSRMTSAFPYHLYRRLFGARP